MDIKINLLPPERKAELKNLRIAGIVFKIGISALLALLTLYVFILLCAKAINIYKVVFDQEVENFIKSESYLEAQRAQNEIKHSSEQAHKIKKGLAQKTNYWSIFEQLNEIIPGDIYLKRIGIEENKLRINGIAQKRESLLVFGQKIEGCEIFSELDSPISNLVANENIDFELSVTIKQ